MLTVNDYDGKSDSDRIEAAVKDRRNGTVFIPRRESKNGDDRDFWLIDRAILLPEDTTVVLQNAKIKLSDNCRDNFFRTANCGFGFDEPAPIKNIHISGEGRCVLEGADRPRSTGDGSKLLSEISPKTDSDLLKYAPWISDESRASGSLDFTDVHSHTYGTDAGRAGESQYGDWRNVGILFANVTDFSIDNIHMKDPHGWAVSLEACSNGRVSNMSFDALMSRSIDGMLRNVENQDGIDLRSGCHDIIVSDITGRTGDDIVALTAIYGGEYLPGGSLRTTQVMGSGRPDSDRDIHDIIVRGVSGYSKGGADCGCCNCLRLLPVEARIYNVIIDGVIDTSPEGERQSAVIQLGEPDGAYGRNEPDSMRAVAISNVICDSLHAIYVLGYLTDSVITNVVNRCPDCPAVSVLRPDGLKNVSITGVVSAGGITEYIH